MSDATAPGFGDLRDGTLRGRSFTIARWILLRLCRVVLGMRVIGADRVPAAGGIMVVSNHLHNADPLLICIATPRPVHYMAKVELIRTPVIGRIIRFGGAFPVDRGRADRNAIRRAAATVEQGIAVGMFPEGTRSRTRRIERVLPGAGMIALRGNVPVVPVAVTGSERLPFNGSKAMKRLDRATLSRRRRGVTITFGEPFDLPVTTDGKRTTAESATDLMMWRIAELLPAEYRGVYGSASSPNANSTSSPSTDRSISSSSMSSDGGTTNAPSSS